MKLGRCRAAGLCGVILTVWWLVGPSPTRAQTTVSSAEVHLPIQNAAGLQLLVATEHTSPVLRVVLPGHPTSDRSIEILFPEHVTVVKQGQRSSQQLYMFSPGRGGDRPLWRRSAGSLDTSVICEMGSICSREPRWRATACASVMKLQTTLG